MLKEMRHEWPFFASRLSMLDMVYAKSNSMINVLYDETLVDSELRGLGQDLREQLAKDINSVQRILEVDTLMAVIPGAWSRLA